MLALKDTAIALGDPRLFREANYIDGRWVMPAGDMISVTDPATGEVIGAVPKASLADTRVAIAAAERAFPAWSRLPAKERARILMRWLDLIIENVTDLALILTSEQGKPLKEAEGEIRYGASFIEWFAEESKRVYGETIPSPSPDQRIIVLKQPVGVCAAITPWNFPMAMIPRKAGPALAAGCTMILKPASATPFSALALAELADRAGMPAGVFNVLTGSSSVVGDELTTHPTIRKVTFTGSTRVGSELMVKAAPTIKKLSLELGGNAPLIVFDDADLDLAVKGAMASKFRNGGQTCVCANRIYVQAGIYDAFVEKFTAAVAALKVGNGLEPGVEIGPLIDGAAVEKVEEHIADALAAGATTTTGGKSHRLGGTFFEPTVIAGATQAMKIATEETFGPVAPLFRFETEDEAIALANATEFGLAAYFFTRDNGRVWRVSERIEAGIVAVNTGAFSYEGAPFGGVKHSGLGREGSRHGIEDFLEIKYVCIGAVLS